MAQVDLICGPYRMVSLMSAEAADELGLEPGVRAIARSSPPTSSSRGPDDAPRAVVASVLLLLLPLAACGARRRER